MTSLVPSYLLKVRRAKLHLEEVERLVSEYADLRPYTMSKGMEDENGKCFHRLEFTEQPDDLIAIVAGDVIHNVRSGLNHLAASLVTEDRLNQVQFPIFIKDPFEIDSVMGKQFVDRSRDRDAWKRFTTGMHSDAIAFLERVQPYTAMWNEGRGKDGFSIVEKLSNRDKHRQLILLATGLNDGVLTYIWPDGTKITRTRFGNLKDGAHDPLPMPAEVDVEIEGTVAIAIDLRGEGGHSQFYELLGSLQKAVNVLELLTIRCLVPFIVR